MHKHRKYQKASLHIRNGNERTYQWRKFVLGGKDKQRSEYKKDTDKEKDRDIGIGDTQGDREKYIERIRYLYIERIRYL